MPNDLCPNDPGKANSLWPRRRVLQMAAAAPTLISAAPAWGEDIEYGAYDEFTLFNQDGGPLKDRILFVFHGFSSAMPNGAYKKLHSGYASRYSVIGFNYDYFDLASNDRFMELVWNKVLKDRDVTFAGTSLGGFWANYYAEQYGVERVLMANPVTDPMTQLRQFVGHHYIEKRDKDIEVTHADVDRYDGRASAPNPDLTRLVILSKDDAVLDYELADAHYSGPNDTKAIFDEGGHTLDLSQEQYVSLIQVFLRMTE